MSEWRSLGSGTWYSLYTCSHRDGPSGALVRFGGGTEDDGYDRDGVCVGAISWCAECRGATWELVSLEPLHVEPSVRTTCHVHAEHHGWIREGHWMPA